MTLSKKEVSPSQRRQVFRLGAGLGLGTLLAACGGGGGDSDSDDSRNLRAALDRLKAGMNEEEIVAAVGWQPNDGYLDWASGDEWLSVLAYTISGNNRGPIIHNATYIKGVEAIRRNYLD